MLYESLKHRSKDLVLYEQVLGVNTGTNTQSPQQADVSLTSEEREAALALGSLFASV